jgi:hypothetical protein
MDILSISTTRDLEIVDLEGSFAHYLEHLLRLDAEARRRRFVGTLSDSAILQYVARIDTHDTRIIGCFVDDKARSALELRSMSTPDFTICELALSAETGWQDLSIAEALLAEAVRLAPGLGIDSFVMLAGPRDPTWTALAPKFGAHLATRSGDWIWSMAPRRPSAARTSPSYAPRSVAYALHPD